jgi:hypothetical protein
MAHPFTTLVYIVLAFASYFFPAEGTAQSKRNLVPPIMLTIAYFFWLIASHTVNLSSSVEDWIVRWWPPQFINSFYPLMFTGMRFNGHSDLFVLTIWILIASIVAYYGIAGRKKIAGMRRPILLFTLTLIGYAVLPFFIFKYQFFNSRLAPISYFFLMIVLSRVSIPRVAGYAISALILILLFKTSQIQQTVSKETSEILPLLSKMHKNAKILPLMFDSSTAELDPVFFYQMHEHDSFYYHILVGGGTNPNLFRNPMLPIQFKRDLRLPKPSRLDDIQWSEYEPYYEYVLARGPTVEFIRSIPANIYFMGSSGKWYLFKKRKK